MLNVTARENKNMNIGKHKGLRAKFGNDNGYFFQTMKVDEVYLFIFDDCELGHNGDGYFKWFPDEWNDELIGRCWYVDINDINNITFNKKIIL